MTQDFQGPSIQVLSGTGDGAGRRNSRRSFGPLSPSSRGPPLCFCYLGARFSSQVFWLFQSQDSPDTGIKIWLLKVQDCKARSSSSPVSHTPGHFSPLQSLSSYLSPQLGGGSGFGAAIARRFGEEGAKVIVTDINVEGGEKVAAQNPANLVFQRMDVTQEGDWQAVVDLAFSKFGGLDVLVNNAGTTYRNKVSTSSTRRMTAKYPITKIFGSLPPKSPRMNGSGSLRSMSRASTWLVRS